MRWLGDRTCARFPVIGPAAWGVTRNIGRVDRSAGIPGGAEFRNREQIPRLCAYACGLACCFSSLLRAQKREENYIADGFGTGEQHRQTINADPLASRWRHAVRKSANVIFIHHMSFFVAALSL